MVLIAQIFGLLGTLMSILYLHGKNMKNVLYMKLGIDLLWGVHYVLLNALNGFFANLICCFREIVFLNSNKKVFKSKLWLLFFVLLNWIFAIFTWENLYSFLPAIGSTLATYSFWQKNIFTARCIGLLNNIVFFTYDVFVGSYTGMLCETVTFVSIIISIIINKKRSIKNDKSQCDFNK